MKTDGIINNIFIQCGKQRKSMKKPTDQTSGVNILNPEHKQHTKCFGIIQRLLHTGTHAIAVFLGFDHCQRDIWLVIQDVIGTLLLTTGMQLAPHDDAPLGEAHFLPNLAMQIPPAPVMAGVMYLVQISRSERLFLSAIVRGCPCVYLVVKQRSKVPLPAWILTKKI